MWTYSIVHTLSEHTDQSFGIAPHLCIQPRRLQHQSGIPSPVYATHVWECLHKTLVSLQTLQACNVKHSPDAPEQPHLFLPQKGHFT